MHNITQSLATTHEEGISFMKPRVLILKTDGTNCDQETAFAFQTAGAEAEIVYMQQLRSKEKRLDDFQILAIPGGFSYGDDIASGKIFAVELLTFLRDQLEQFVAQDKLIIGICNGFQILVRTGLLPFGNLDAIDATLNVNDIGRFECRWVNMIVEESPSLFTQSLQGTTIMMQVAHAEGNFFASPALLDQIEQQNLVALRYTFEHKPTQTFPYNPNGSMHAIAGICNKQGTILGLMPHPERFIIKEQHPNWRRMQIAKPHGLQLFENAVSHF